MASLGRGQDCANRNLGQIVDYESIVSTKGEDLWFLYPEINTTAFVCDSGCDPNVSPICEDAYKYDIESNTINEGQPNPFVQEFECTNINFEEAIMPKYYQCKTYPVFPALFYDYDSERHEAMIVEQLNPYRDALSGCVTKFFITLFIWFLTKTCFFPIFFRFEESIAERCCDAIRLRRVVEVDVARVNPLADQEKLLIKEIDLEAAANLRSIQLNEDDDDLDFDLSDGEVSTK